MASFSSPTIFGLIHLITVFLTFSVSHSLLDCYTSIISFGDSLADTGNKIRQSNYAYYANRLPYGETYFHHPTGRFSDGRLIVDFIAEELGLPYVPPYLGGSSDGDFRQGVNFAFAGATALDAAFFQERGIPNEYTNNSLGIQLGWFEDLLPSLCSNPPDCEDIFRRSLFLVGEIGGNDYNHPFLQRRSMEEIRTFVPLVINAIGSTVDAFEWSYSSSASNYSRVIFIRWQSTTSQSAVQLFPRKQTAGCAYTSDLPCVYVAKFCGPRHDIFVISTPSIHSTLIKYGARTLVVPGNLPIGCSAAYLTVFESPRKEDYDPLTGCLSYLNEFAEYHNRLLLKELDRLRALYPNATIIYADYYNAALRFYRSPRDFGFYDGALTACCGGGGPYNYNTSAKCGYNGATLCDNPSSHVAWDGIHLTEAAYRWIADGLMRGPFLTPSITTPCLSLGSHDQHCYGQ